ncbi:hypothetical protein ACSMFS_05940 [Shewanella xiamenensis]|uniref:hypothetical protein n=1 Tax=Shewanella xiamenensis TaxID=332186 RepID=UPI003F19A16B
MVKISSKPAIYSMFSLFIRMFAGPLAIVFIATKLTLTEQGIYYTFISVGAVQFVFELGFSTCLVQFLAGSKSNRHKYSFIKFGLIFYCAAISLMFITILVLANYLFADLMYEWHLPFYFYLLSLILTVAANFFLVIDEGNIKVNAVYKTKMVSSIFYTITLIFSLYYEFGLYSLSISQFMLAIIILARHHKVIKILLISAKVKNSEKLSVVSKTVFTFQYKLAIVWVFGYLFWNSFTLYFFKFESPDIAGKFGATNNVLNSLAFASASWLQTKRSIIGSFNANNNVFIGAKLALKSSFFSLITFGLTGVAFVFSIVWVPEILSSRFLEYGACFLFLIYRFFVLIQELILIYTRMFKDEPFYLFTALNYVSVAILIFSNVYINYTVDIFVQVMVLQMLYSTAFLYKLNKYLKLRLSESST